MFAASCVFWHCVFWHWHLAEPLWDTMTFLYSNLRHGRRNRAEEVVPLLHHQNDPHINHRILNNDGIWREHEDSDRL